jgi:tetratricopeptide (TPR) repeat protein
VRIRERLWGRDSFPTAQAYFFLSEIYFNEGRLDEAIDLMRDAVTVCRGELLVGHSYTARRIGDLAILYVYNGEYDEAEPLFQTALSTLLDIEGNPGRLRRLDARVGAARWNAGWLLANYARLKSSRGQYEAAEDMFDEALAIFRRIWGNEHEKVGWCLHWYAEMLFEKGEHARAERLAREAISVRATLSGAQYRTLADSQTLLARILVVAGEVDEAEGFFHKALELYQTGEYAKPWEAARCYNGYAALLISRESYEKAGSVCRTALAITTSYFGGAHPQVGQSLTALARVLLDQGKVAEAEEVLERAGRAFEMSRRRVSVRSLERAEYAAFASPYPMLALARLRLKRSNEAWEAAEHDRGRALLDMLAIRRGRELSPEQLAKERQLAVELGRLEGTLTVLDRDDSAVASAAADSVQNLLLEAQSQWAAFQKRMREEYPMSEGGSYPLERIQSILEPEAAVLGWVDAGNTGHCVESTTREWHRSLMNSREWTTSTSFLRVQ